MSTQMKTYFAMRFLNRAEMNPKVENIQNTPLLLRPDVKVKWLKKRMAPHPNLKKVAHKREMNTQLKFEKKVYDKSHLFNRVFVNELFHYLIINICIEKVIQKLILDE